MDGLLAELAARQHGVVSREQLAELGLGRGAVARRVRTGRLHRVHRGVYAVGHPVLAREGRWLAAVLSCGPSAVLSHRSAAALWEIRPTAAQRVDVTVPAENCRRSTRAIVVHHSMRLSPHQTTTRQGIPITTPMRTLTDLAEVVPRRGLERGVEQADALGLLDLKQLDAGPAGRAGPKRVRDVLQEHGFLDAPTRSELERVFLALCRRHDLPSPSVNAAVAGVEADFSWPDKNVVVETDGHRYHGTRAAFERDRARDAELTAQGLRVVRFTYRQVTREPARVANTLRRLLT